MLRIFMQMCCKFLLYISNKTAKHFLNWAMFKTFQPEGKGAPICDLLHDNYYTL